MSHIVSIKTEVRDPVALQAACRRLQLEQPSQGTFKLFEGEVTGLGVNLPGWKYPVVCNTETGQLQLDDFAGRWGDRVHLDRLLQRYAVEKAVIEARKKGYSVTEQQLADGSIKLTVQVNGGAS